ncbi:hypothetical protein BH09PSE2_BH09PSE2_00210 [soil metagenome]
MIRGRTARLIPAFIWAASSSFALAQTPSPPATKPTPLSGITVDAGLSALVVDGRRLCVLTPPAGVTPQTPKVVDSWPKPTDSPPAGLLYMRVTYSERMSPCGFLLADSFFPPGPEFLAEPAMLTRDYKTFYFAVRTEPGKPYATSFNRRFSKPFFKSLYGVGAPAFTVSFKTSATAAPSSTPKAALLADPGSQDVAQEPERLIKLWSPREDSDGPECGRCDKDALARGEGPPVDPPKGR